MRAQGLRDQHKRHNLDVFMKILHMNLSLSTTYYQHEYLYRSIERYRYLKINGALRKPSGLRPRTTSTFSSVLFDALAKIREKRSIEPLLYISL